MPDSLTDLVPLASTGSAALESLLDRAFGADRHRRTAYKVRGSARAIMALSFGAVEHGALVGSIQCWPVMLSGDGGSAHPLVMVGPVAVAPERQRAGLGRALMERALAVADAAGPALTGEGLMLIGDPEYYARFGFVADRTGQWRLPGPVERHRLLARGPRVPAVAGMLGSAVPVPA